MSKAQTSIFIIIGLVIAMFFFMLIYLMNTLFDFSPLLTEDDVKYYVELCVKYTTEQGLHTMGVQGGHITISKPFYTTPFSDVVYNDYLPTLDSMEFELQEYINSNIASCIYNFTTSKNLVIDDPDSQVLFSQRNVIVTLNEFVSLKTNDTIKRIPHVQSDAVRVRIPLLAYVASNIKKDKIDMGLLSQAGFNTTIFTFANDTVYVITDKLSNIRTKEYKFITVV